MLLLQGKNIELVFSCMEIIDHLFTSEVVGRRLTQNAPCYM